MATKREQTLLHNRTAQGFVVIGSFICMSVTWVGIIERQATWLDWCGLVAAAALFFYFLSITIKGRRIRRDERTLSGRNG